MNTYISSLSRFGERGLRVPTSHLNSDGSGSAHTRVSPALYPIGLTDINETGTSVARLANRPSLHATAVETTFSNHRWLFFLVLMLVGSAFPFSARCNATATAAPVYSLANGTYTSAQTVTISDTTSGAAIYYTTDGSTPTVQSTQYTSPISLPAPGSLTILAVALAPGDTLSAVAKAVYAVSLTTATPVASVAPGTYPTAQSITLTDATPGAVIYYTINGGGPTTSSPVYSAPITLSTNSYILARAIAPSYVQSVEMSNTYSFLASPPVISVPSGTYSSAQTVALSSSTPGAGFYYTADGSTPTTSSKWYNGPITVSASETFQAITWSSTTNVSPVSSASYTIAPPGTTATPLYSLANGTYTSAQTVTISDATAGAAIYYTTNGSTPTAQSTLYTGPISLSAPGSSTFEAIALAPGDSLSAVANAAYTISLTTATPVASVAPGTYPTAQSITLTDATPGAVIYYTINGAGPTTSSPVYSAPITLSTNSYIMARAYTTNYVQSAAATFTYSFMASLPVISLPSGTYSSAQTVALSSSTPGAGFYYTTNGSTPTTSSSWYNGPVTVSASETFQAITWSSNTNVSPVSSATYTIAPPAATATPLYSLANGTYTSAQTVTISDATAGAAIYYTTNGSTPTAQSTLYTGPISLSAPGSSTFEAIALAPGDSLSAVANAAYTISLTTATPVASVAPGTYPTAQSITLTDATPGAVIYYTINGGGPTTSSPVYSAPITLSTNSYIMARAYTTNYVQSAAATFTYSFMASPPVISLPSGTYSSAQTVALSSSTPGAGFYYTTNGSTPTTSSSWYNGPVTVSANETFQAITWSSNTNVSPVSSATYTIQLPAPAPTFSPAAGTYTTNQTASISCSNANAVIYYTTNGSTPTTSSAIYSGPLTVSSNETLSAMALAPGGSDSPVSQAQYTITPPAAAPVYSLAAGDYTTVQTVALSDATPGATIYYTTDGSTPTSQSLPYTGPITVSASTSFAAAALAPGGSLSPVTKAWYTIILPTAMPVISPASGTYNTIQSVTLSTPTPGATIYYTLDGTYPTTSSPVYSGPITATTNTAIIALATAPNYSTSSGARANYTIVAPPPTITPQSGTAAGATTVTISDAVPGAVIYYTSNGSIPTTSSAVYTGPITVSPQETATQVYYAFATANGYLQSSPTMVTFTVDEPAGTLAQATVNPTPGRTIPSTFMGLSMLYNFPAGIMGQASTGANQPYYQLVNNLEQYSTAPMLIRLLGDGTQTSNIQADVEPLVELSQAVNVNYILGVDLLNDNLSIAEAEASTWMNGIPNSLIQAFEIGNEPNCYPVNGNRPSSYVFANYLPEYQEWVQGVQAATSNSFGIMGPSYGDETAYVRTTWIAGAQSAFTSGAMTPSIVSQHYYPYGPGTYAADVLLQPASTLGMLTDFKNYSASAHQAGSLFRLGEMNTIWNGGIAGISNTFSAALWSIDVMFNVANIGVDGVNWHSGQGTNYQLYQFNLITSGGMTTYQVAQVNPLYYGLLVFAQMAGRGAKLLPVTTTTTANVSIWATVDNTSTAHVVVINKDEQATGNVQINLPGYTTGTVRYLSAANYSATNGVTLGGQTFDGTPDGTIQGQLVTTTISAQNGVFTLPNMPITSAAIIDFSN